MSLIGNLLWLVFGGLIAGLWYFLCGVVLCITIIGIPFGAKLIKMSWLAFFPFGKNVQLDPAEGCFSTVFNVIWVVTGWWEVAAFHLIVGIILCITIIGIPFGKQHFKLARYSLFPFGCTIS